MCQNDRVENANTTARLPGAVPQLLPFPEAGTACHSFLKDLKLIKLHECSLFLLVEGQGMLCSEEILATQKLMWPTMETTSLVTCCSFTAVVVPLMELCMSFEEQLPHLPCQTNTLYLVVCSPASGSTEDNLFSKIVSFLVSPDAGLEQHFSSASLECSSKRLS